MRNEHTPEKNTPRPCQAANLAALPSISHGFFTREGGVSQGIYDSLNCGLGAHDDTDKVRINRARAVEWLGIEKNRLATAYQVHSAKVLPVEEAVEGADAPHVDGLVTTAPGLALGVLSADCAPVLLADPAAGVIAVAHAGNVGALAGIIPATVGEMEKSGATRQNIHAALGPTISAHSYEVGAEFVARFLRIDRAHARYFAAAAREGHAMFDLPGFVLAQLHALNLASILNLDLCTYTDEKRFFSYRRATHAQHDDYGRQLSAIAIMS